MTDMKSSNDIKASTKEVILIIILAKNLKTPCLNFILVMEIKEVKIDISIKEKWEIAIIYWNFYTVDGDIKIE